MDLEIRVEGALESGAECSVFSLLERSGKEEALPSSLLAVDEVTGGLLTIAWNRKEIRGKKGEITLFPLPGGKRRVALVGMGKREAYSVESVRLAAGYLGRSLKGKGVKELACHLADFTLGKLDPASTASALTDGIRLGSYQFTRYKSEKEEPPTQRLLIALGEKHRSAKGEVSKRSAWEMSLLNTVLWGRDIGNIPADVATPQFLATEAVKLGKEKSLKVTVFDEKKLKELGCGAILAVGSGSAHPPRLVILEYPGSGKPRKTIAVAGKGITFDSGGISIKGALGMDGMKFDKSGAMDVMSLLRAAADLKVAPRVIGLMALAENLPGGSAYRPGDVVRAYSGKTIEVLNTDAEGRVVLADALSYAVANYHPDEVIDLATLTGACAVALGSDTAGLFSLDDALASRLLLSSEATGERIWRMPLTDVHKEMVKSDIADVRNVTELPFGGALTAAAFLSEFVGETPWAHIDIAGPGMASRTGSSYLPPYFTPGYTAFGVRLLAHYLSQ